MSRSIGARKKYTPEILAEASKIVQSGSISLNAASISYGIPKSTLHDAVKGKYATNRTGPRTVLSTAEESRLADWVMQMAKIGYGRTRQELLATVKTILDDDGRKTPFKNNKPGKDWYRGFCRRHPKISEKAPMQLGKERAVVTPAKIENWFRELNEFLDKEVKDPELIRDPSRLYNADESGFPLCPKSGKVLAMRGAKHVYNYTSSSKTQMTVLACVSAIGHYIRPLIVYPGERFRTNILEGFEDAAMGRSINGWMDSELFLTWLRDVFIPDLNDRQVRRPVLLFVDGHSTHLTIEASDICRENGVHMFCLLEHASHIIQPLDLRVFGVLKENWGQAVRDYQIQNIPNTVTKKSFAQVFKGAWEKSATVENAIKAFKYAGLFPLDPSIVLQTAKMEPSKVFRQSYPSACKESISTAVSSSSSISLNATSTVPCSTISSGCNAEVRETLESAPSSNVRITLDSLPCSSLTSNCLTPESLPCTNDRMACIHMTQANVPHSSMTFAPVSNQCSENKTNTNASPNAMPLSSATDEEMSLPVSLSLTTDIESTIPIRPELTTSVNDQASIVPNSIQKSASPFSKYLKLPDASTHQKVKGKRQQFPKAVTGQAFRQMLFDRQAEKEKHEREKLKRKEDRELRKKQKEEEKERKQKEREEKKRKREEAKEQRLKAKELKKKLLSLEKRRRTESSSSDSSIDYLPNDDSEFELNFDSKKCYKCGVAYTDDKPLEWIACNNCPRLFHKACTDIPFEEMTEEEASLFPFECLFC